MFKKGEYVEVNNKIHTQDNWKPPRHNLEGRCGIVVKEHDEHPSIQFYRDSRKEPSIPQNVPYICLKKISKEEYIACILQC